MEIMGFLGGSGGKNLPANAGDAGDLGLIPGLGRFPGGRNGSPLQYSCLGNPMDRGAWWATVHGVTTQNWARRTHPRVRGIHCTGSPSFSSLLRVVENERKKPLPHCQCPPPQCRRGTVFTLFRGLQCLCTTGKGRWISYSFYRQRFALTNLNTFHKEKGRRQQPLAFS